MNNKKVIHMLTLFSVMFLGLIVYLTVTNIYYSDEYKESAYNTRNTAQEAKIKRGTIIDRNGTVLAFNEKDENGRQQRVYPFDNLYSHVIGYSSGQYGKSLVEKQYNQHLLGKSDMAQVFSLERLFDNHDTEGNDLTLTIDHKLQQKAKSLMKNYTGALVAMNPQTGEILAMVSLPDFDPNDSSLEKNWQTLNTSENSPFLARALSGLYPPGSTYKVVTSSVIVEAGRQRDIVSDTTGKAEIGSKAISNAGGSIYGDTNLERGFTKSSNVYYAMMGSELDDSLHRDMAERFLFNQSLDFDLPHSKSKFETGRMTPLDCAIASIGQGKTLTTPLHLALICSAIANNGSMPKPYIVSQISKDNRAIQNTSPSILARPIDPAVAAELKELMYLTVQSGTGTKAQIPGIKVCGKTGTAENEKTLEDESKTHATFIGFAPYDNPQIAVSVVLEHAGYGGTVAAPIAREVIRQYLGK